MQWGPKWIPPKLGRIQCNHEKFLPPRHLYSYWCESIFFIYILPLDLNMELTKVPLRQLVKCKAWFWLPLPIGSISMLNINLKDLNYHALRDVFDVMHPSRLSFLCWSQCADAGYHLSLEQVMQAYLSSRWQTQKNLGTGLQHLQGTVSGLDQSQDRDTLLQEHFNTFCMPLRFPYRPHDGDQVFIIFPSNQIYDKSIIDINYVIVFPSLRSLRSVLSVSWGLNWRPHLKKFKPAWRQFLRKRRR